MITAGCNGCNQNPYVTAQAPGLQNQQPHVAQLQDLDRRATALDQDNRDLHAQLAKSQQQNQLLQDEVELLRKQLADHSAELQELLAAKTDAERRAETIKASTRLRGGATITANNSFRDELPLRELPGLEVRRDDDLVRIELPVDRLFKQGTDQLLPGAGRLIDRVAATIRQAYAHQLIGIEGHTDSMPHGSLSLHELSTRQAMAVFHTLTQRSQLPPRQLFTVGYGANRPLVSNATPAGRARNRRIEVVVYPEKMGE